MGKGLPRAHFTPGCGGAGPGGGGALGGRGLWRTWESRRRTEGPHAQVRVHGLYTCRASLSYTKRDRMKSPLRGHDEKVFDKNEGGKGWS